jgi:hypothetical protein
MSDWNRPTAIEGVTAGPAALVIFLVSIIGLIAILSCTNIDDPRERMFMPLELRGALCVWDRIRASMRNQTVLLAGPPAQEPQIVAAPEEVPREPQIVAAPPEVPPSKEKVN